MQKGRAMSNSILDDETWAAVSKIIPPTKRRTASNIGRKRLDGRAALSGILFVLMSNLPWKDLPLALGFGSGLTCYRRLRTWQKMGVWPAIRDTLILRLRNGERIEWWRAEASAGVVRTVMKKKAQARRNRELKHRLQLVANDAPVAF